MKYLEIGNGKCINLEKVEALESIDQLRTRVYMTNGGVYEANFPYMTLISILETSQEAKEEVAENVNAMAKNFGFFAG